MGFPVNASWLRQLRTALARTGPAFRDPDLVSDLASEKAVVANALRAAVASCRGLAVLPPDEEVVDVPPGESFTPSEPGTYRVRFREVVAQRGPSAPISGGMPGWYFMLTDLTEDPGAPRDVRMHAEFAVTFINDLRNAHRRLQEDYDRLHAKTQDLRLVRDRADEVANGEGWTHEESEVARHILGDSGGR